MKKTRVLIAGLIALASLAVATMAQAAVAVQDKVASVTASAGDVGRAVLRTVANAVNRAIVEYQLLNGSPALYATTKSDVYAQIKPRRTTPMDSQPLEVLVPFVLGAANPVVNDCIILCDVPAGVDVVDYDIMGDDADTNGAPTIAFSLGTMNAGLTDLATVWQAGITVFQNAGYARMLNAAPFVEANTPARLVGLKWTAAAATYAAGKKGLLRLKVATL